jgi:hypothetical protein
MYNPYDLITLNNHIVNYDNSYKMKILDIYNSVKTYLDLPPNYNYICNEIVKIDDNGYYNCIEVDDVNVNLDKAVRFSDNFIKKFKDRVWLDYQMTYHYRSARLVKKLGYKQLCYSNNINPIERLIYTTVLTSEYIDMYFYMLDLAYLLIFQYDRIPKNRLDSLSHYDMANALIKIARLGYVITKEDLMIILSSSGIYYTDLILLPNVLNAVHDIIFDRQ